MIHKVHQFHQSTQTKCNTFTPQFPTANIKILLDLRIIQLWYQKCKFEVNLGVFGTKEFMENDFENQQYCLNVSKKSTNFFCLCVENLFSFIFNIYKKLFIFDKYKHKVRNSA